jgi:acyl dehydratase
MTIDWRYGKITDADIEKMRARIGVPQREAPWNSAASYDAIWHFALGVGDDNPLWWDPRYAASTRWKRMFAPPTFLYTCFRGGPRDGKPPSGLDEFEELPGMMGLWSDDRWVLLSHAWVDERIIATTELHEVRELEAAFSGRSVAQVHKTVFYGEDSRRIAELYKTVIRIERSESRARGKYVDTPEAHYSEADLRGFHQQYESEPTQRRGHRTLYWEDVQPGDEMITLLKGPLTMTNLVGWQQGWGSLLCQTNRIAYQTLRDYPGSRLLNPESGIEDTLAGGHWDPYFTTMGGMARAYDFGGQRISWLAHLLTDWCGDDGFVAEHHVRLRRPNFLGDCTWLTGVVKSKHGELEPARLELGSDYGAVECHVTGTNQRGEVTATARAIVGLPKRHESPHAGRR